MAGANGCGDEQGMYKPIPTALPAGQDVLQAAKKVNEQAAQASCIESTAFQCFGASLILSNALVIGLETDLGHWQYWGIVEHIFLLLFLLELLTRICVMGLVSFFCRSADLSWNYFDFFIVALGVFDFTMECLTGTKGAGSMATLFRIIRLLRILRIFKVLKFLKQLYVLAFGLVEAVKAVFWVTILMLFVLYVCSIVVVKTVGRPAEDDPYREFMTYRFGHILDSMLSLFILMSSPNLPTYEAQTGLLQTMPGLALFLCGFVMFGSFGIVALLTGVISQSMFEKNEARRAEIITEHEEMRRSLGVKCAELFSTLVDIDQNGEARTETVKTLAADMWLMLEKAGADITHADVLNIIDFMDVNGTGLIGESEFRSTIEKIADGLSPLGMQEIANRVGVCESKLGHVQGNLDALSLNIMELAKGMQVLLDHHGSQARAFR